jgi:formylglycine-generating enzyme required for sulfatase activity
VVRRPASREPIPCRDVVIPIRKLPGFSPAARNASPAARFSVRIPSCQATREDMVEVPAGPYVAGGIGDPPGEFAAGEMTPEDPQRHVSTYWIDRTEATIAAMAVYFEMTALHRFAAPPRPNTEQLEGTDQPPYPAIAITWREARAYCRYLGKDLPTLDQWDKALRGGPLVDGKPNPCPRRNFSQCGGIEHSATNVRVGDVARLAPATKHPDDLSPFGVQGLVGGTQEWTRSFAAPRSSLTMVLPELRRFFHHVPSPFVITRGCNWSDLECSTAPLTMMPIENERARDTRLFPFGFRCAI